MADTVWLTIDWREAATAMPEAHQRNALLSKRWGFAPGAISMPELQNKPDFIILTVLKEDLPTTSL